MPIIIITGMKNFTGIAVFGRTFLMISHMTSQIKVFSLVFALTLLSSCTEKFKHLTKTKTGAIVSSNGNGFNNNPYVDPSQGGTSTGGGTTTPPPVTTYPSTKEFEVGTTDLEILKAGETIQLEHGTWAYQNDANLVFYSDGPKWASDTGGTRNCTTGCRMVLKANGNLVLMKDGVIYWQTSTGINQLPSSLRADTMQLLQVPPYVKVLTANATLLYSGIRKTYPLTRSETNSRFVDPSDDQLWRSSRAIDGDNGTIYSSAQNPTGEVNLDVYTSTPSLLRSIRMVTRLDANNRPLVWSPSFKVSVRNADDNAWVFLMNVTTAANPVNSAGQVEIPLGTAAILTNGIRFTPILYGTEVFGNTTYRYFQVAEVAVAL